jgi:arginine decarboxylase
MQHHPHTISYTAPQSETWTAQESANLYGVREWGSDYFDVSEQGNVVVKAPFGDVTVDVPLIDIVEGMKERGMDMPAILRIDNLLDLRIKQLNDAFAEAIAKLDYQNSYRGV